MILGAANLEGGGKQKSVPTASRNGSFNTDTAKPLVPTPSAGPAPTTTQKNVIKPGYHDSGNTAVTMLTGVASGLTNSVVNTIKDIGANPTGAVTSRVVNAGLDIGQAGANVVANAWNANPGFKRVTSALGKDDFRVPNVKAPKIIYNPRQGELRGEGGSVNSRPELGTPWSLGTYVPGKTLESIQRISDGASFIPGGKALSGAKKLLGPRQFTKTIEKTFESPWVNKYSERFDDNASKNSQKVLESIYREAQERAEAEGRGAFDVNLDVPKVVEERYKPVYQHLLDTKQISADDYPDFKTFFDRLPQHGGGGDLERVTDPLDIVKAINKGYLDVHHGAGASERPLVFYRGGSDSKRGGSGDYSLDRDLAYSFNGARPRWMTELSPEELSYPIVGSSLYGRGGAQMAFPDEWAQNIGERTFERAGVTPKFIGEELRGTRWGGSPRTAVGRNEFRYNAQDVKNIDNVINTMSDKDFQSMVEKYGVTDEDLAVFKGWRDSRTEATFENGSPVSRQFPNQREAINNLRSADWHSAQYISPENPDEFMRVRKVSDMLYREGLIDRPYIKNKFDAKTIDRGTRSPIKFREKVNEVYVPTPRGPQAKQTAADVAAFGAMTGLQPQNKKK